jgi:thiol-disulfide isomerase/thioredoxin
VRAALLLFALVASACDKSPDVVTSRSEQVIATGTMPTSAPSDSPAHALGAATDAHAPPLPRARKLCQGDGNAKGRALSSAVPGHVEAAGAPRLDPAAALARGAWTWLNFWAAWCGPCKEEMGRLLGWQDKLAKAGTPVRFVFLSIDDDQRQLAQFLEEQPPQGLKSSLWLPDGPARASWLQSLRMKSAPELPEQALVDPKGRVVCFVEGAVEESDYAEVAALVGR